MRRWIGLASLTVAVVGAGGCTDPNKPKQAETESATKTVVNTNHTVVITSEVKHDLSPTLRSMKIAPLMAERVAQTHQVVPLRPTKNKPGARTASTPLEEEEEESDRNAIGQPPVADPVSQTTPPTPGEAPAQGLGFEAVGNGFMGPDGTYTVNVAPPDPSAEVGPAHIVQIVNLAFAVFDKFTGTPVLGPRLNNTLWTGFGGICETSNSGDPTVVYDQLADRWILSQFALASPNFRQCVAVSQTGDPTGAYFRYEFSYNAFPDYPKMGVWPDAYYTTFNMFPSGFGGSKVCAYDRAKMLQGQPATQQCFDLSVDFPSLLPSDVDGATPPPAGSPAFIVNVMPSPAAHLNLWKFHVDWTTPANSTLTGPTEIPVAAYAEACNGFGDCVPQPGTSQLLEGLGERLLYRLGYRNFGDHESLTAMHNVAVGNAVGERWYEIRSPGGTPTIFQQGTFAPGNTDPNPNHRWMGSMAMDKVGNIGMGYTISGTAQKPSIRFTGRLFSDPLGELPAGEGTLIEGPAVQSGVNRWGDYSQLTVDPTDDCTFWYTHEYQAVNGGFNWHTRIGSFQVGPCDSGPPKLHQVTVNPASLEGGGASVGTVLITNLAPAGGITITLASANPSLVMVPASVTVPEGKQKATFNITTAQTPTQTDVVVNATLDAVTKSATLTLLASPTPAALTLNPAVVVGGQASTATVTLSGPAPAGGAAVALSSTNPAAAPVPATLTIAEGATSGDFTITTTEQLVNTSANITASFHGLSKSALLTINRTVPVGNADFDLVLKAPRCKAGLSFCDTGGLIDGRDGILNGNEPNQPNTLFSACPDNISGAYHSDESQDRLKISTLDGTPLSAGKMVKVEATVWPFSSGSSNFWDLYFTPDANVANPTWQFLVTKQPVGAGLQVVSHTFALPNGALPAIRGHWRFVGTATPCSTGSFDESDDLVFALASDGTDTPPTTIITSPADGAAVGTDIMVTAMASDDMGVTKVELLVDGTVVATDMTAPYEFNATLSGGPHQLQTRATDTANQTGLSAVVHVTVDATSPMAHIDAPLDGAIQGGGVLVNATATDDTGVTKVEMIVDGVVIQTDTTVPYQFSFTQPEGAHTLQVKAYDAAGNTGLSQIVTITVDVTAPVSLINTPVNGAMLSGVVTVQATSMDLHAITHVDLFVNGMNVATDATEPYSFSLDTGTLPAGAAVLKVAGFDVAGNSAFSPDVNVTIVAQKQYTFLEAENATTTAPLTKPTDANASGGKAVQVAAGNNSQAAPPATGHGTIGFTAATAGNYKVWGRLTAPTTAADSWWLRIDTGTWRRWNAIPLGATYHWDDVHDDRAAPTGTGGAPVIFALTAGAHTLEFAYREEGTRLDRLLVTNDLAFVPTGFGTPGAPTNVNAMAGDQQVSLSWTAPTGGAASYNVKRGATGGPYTTVKSGVTTTTATDTGLMNGTQVCYVISAVNGAGEGPNSSPEKCATPAAPTAPQPPTNVMAMAGNNQVTVLWTGSAGATNYNVKKGPKAGPFTFLANTMATMHVDTTAMNGTESCYVVSALNAVGESGDSTPPACATPSGFVYLFPQAESATTTSPLQKVADAAASGGQAVQVATGNNSQDVPPTTGHGKITFTAPAAGNYKVWGRVTAPTNGDDSWWVRIDTGTWRRWNGIPLGAAYHWDDVHDDRAAPTGTGGAAVIFPLTAGSHTLEFAFREDGTRLDRFLITNDPAFVPTGTGP